MLVVVLLTYNRFEYAEITLKSTLDNLHASVPIRLHVADDGSPCGYVDRLVELSNNRDVLVSSSNSNRGGYGANYNLAMQTAHQIEGAKYILPLEDDWELVKPLNIDPILQVLDDGLFGCVRMGYIGYTQELQASFVAARGYHWLSLNPYSPEPHVFAGHPRIETVEWERSVGPWPEGLNPGETEFTVAHMPAARQRVGWPVDLIPPSGNVFAHIGCIRSY